MRTTVTLEPDVAALLERDIAARAVSFKTAVNEAIRRGLSGASTVEFHFPAHDLGTTTHDLDHATALAAALEDEQRAQQLQVGR